MNQINQFLQQMRTLFDGMTPQSKLMAILLTVGIGISSVFLVQGATTGSGTMVYLLGGRSLSDEELDSIEFALSKAALRGFERDGKRLRVPKASSDLYMKAILEGNAMPEGMGSAPRYGLERQFVYGVDSVHSGETHEWQAEGSLECNQANGTVDSRCNHHVR